MSVAEIRRETFYKLTNSADVPEVPSGNRNLLKNTKSFKGSNIGGSSTILNETYQGCTVRYFKNTNPNSARQEVAQFNNCVYPKLGGEYVASFWAKGSGELSIFFHGDQGYLLNDLTVSSWGESTTRYDGYITLNLTDDWQRYWVKYKLRTAPASATSFGKHLLFRHNNSSTEDEIYLAGVQLEEGNVVNDYSPTAEDLGWSTATLVPTQQQRYLWKFEYVYYSDGSVEVTQPVNLTKQNAQRTSRDTIHNVRIAIRDSTDSHNVAFFDNISGIRYQSANLQRFLAGSASILTIEYNSKDIDTIRTGCKLAFIYKERAYWLNIMDLSKKGYKVEITAYSLGLELNQEERGAHKPANAMSFAEYLAYYDPEHALEIGVNEVADKRIKLEWTGTDTILARLFSIANSFDAELEFTVELNQDYSLKRQVLNIYKKGNLGSNQAASPIRVGRSLKVINYSDNLKELRTAVRATGKDGLTIDGLNKKVYDDDGNLLYYSKANTVYAPQSRDKYPSVGKKSNDNWIIKELGETEYSTKEALWGYMLSELKKICVPEITYDIEGAIDGDVGDTRTLIDDVHYDPPLYVQGRISEFTEDLITGKVMKSTLTNFERKYSQVASELLKQVEQLANDAAPYIVRLSTDNGYNFKNGKGTSTITAKLEKYGKIVNANWKWLINNNIVSDNNSVTINASQVIGTLNVVAVATVDGNEVTREYITFTNSDDGVGIKSIKRYYTTNDQSEGVTAGGQNWSTKPATVTADNKYMWSYDVITYTNDTSLVTEPAVIGARGDDGLDADMTGVTEALDKAKQELTALSANIEKVRDDSLAAVNEAKQQLTTVASDLSKAKTDLQNAVSEVDAKATNLQGDLAKAKQDLTSQASQLTAQANAQSELTKRVSSVEETANGTKTTVSELSKTVAQNGKDITSVTTRTKTVEDDLTSTKTTLSQVQTTAYNTSKKTATLENGLDGLSAKFSSLKIGGRNLLAKTNQGKTNWAWSVSKGSWSAETVDVDGISAVKLTRTSAETSSWSVIEYQGLIRNLIEADTDYTLSFDVWNCIKYNVRTTAKT
jgi:predicted  nucleic acid-binding Zn-ribbon protein